MANHPNYHAYSQTGARSAEIDAGLRSYMLKVYNLMALAVAFTGVVALAVASSPAMLQAIYGTPLKWVLFAAIIGTGFFAHRVILGGSVVAAHVLFWSYAAAWGALISPYLIVYTGESLARVFFITSGAFAGLSIYGYTTKRNLAPIGAFLAMATIGLLIAVIVNVFLGSEMLHMGLSVVIVLVFAGLTAYETQLIRNAYTASDGQDALTRKSIFGAFMLYGNFVTIFIWLMQLLGVARN